MSEQTPTLASRSRVKKDSRLSKIFIFLLVFGISAGIFWFVQIEHKQILSIFSPPGQQDTQVPGNVKESGDGRDSISPSRETKQEKNLIPPVQPSQDKSDIPSVQPDAAQNGNSQVAPLSDKGRSPTDGLHPIDLASELEKFFNHLDEQAYLKEFHLPDRSKEHFSRILQKLLDHPPSTTREADDYFTLLKNTAHFFRILGKENTLALKGILDRERNALEPILSTFYSLTDHPELLKERFSLVLTKEPLYDYACFFLNTIGGRLYLFRRDANSRMVVSYYAIRIIDKAHSEGYNRLGIDLRPFIDALIDEMENGGGKLRYREMYLDSLYDMKEKYANQG